MCCDALCNILELISCISRPEYKVLRLLICWSIKDFAKWSWFNFKLKLKFFCFLKITEDAWNSRILKNLVKEFTLFRNNKFLKVLMELKRYTVFQFFFLIWILLSKKSLVILFIFFIVENNKIRTCNQQIKSLRLYHWAIFP